MARSYEPLHEKTGCLHMENKDADKLCNNSLTAQLISAIGFNSRKVQPLFFLNPKFQASSILLWLYRPVCVGPDRKPGRPVSLHSSDI